MRRALAVLTALLAWLAAPSSRAVVFESGPVRPLALSPNATRLFRVNTPDGRLEILSVDEDGLSPLASVRVGLEPVAVAARTDDEVWVVNHLSDSVSIVDVGSEPPRVVRTLLVGDEPNDVAFGGEARARAFITSAHRGQNSGAEIQADASSVGRADVWIFDATAIGAPLGGSPIAIVNLFGDSPRALAVNPDGSRVYAAIFKSGNRTTTVPEEAVCDGGTLAAPCDVDGESMPGGLPLPNTNLDGIPGPEVGLIVRQDDAGTWRDELGRDWSNAARFNLPDLDVFVLDADADPPVQTAAFPGVGTVLFNMVVNPQTGRIYVSNTEAQNEIRLEPRVRGRVHEARISILDEAGATTTRPLNPHIDRSVVPSAVDVAERSLSTPLGMAISADGTTLYVSAFGSDAIGVLDVAELEAGTRVPDTADQIDVSGGGPSGIVLDEPRGRAYVSTRFDVGVSVVDLSTKSEIAHVAFHNPEPEHVRTGRRLLYDARATSSNGESTCASCHVFADTDGLAWDLGTDELSVENNPLPILEGEDGVDPSFHPLKGPMTTQTLRGMATHGSMHWRGDRTGGNDPGGDPHDERAAFSKFNAAFPGLLGRGTELTASDMESLTDFVLEISPPPNPHRRLDDQLTAEQAAGRDAFVGGDCAECHVLSPDQGFFGTGGGTAASGFATQFMKVPHLRNLYQKLGRFFGRLFAPLVDPGHVGDQIRGFGFSHDGSAGRIQDPAGDFLFVFPSNLKPIVGQQVTLTRNSGLDVSGRIDLLVARALAGDCDLTVSGTLDGEARGFLLQDTGTFSSDRVAEPHRSDSELRALATAPGQELTYTCVPPGNGDRRARDRDGDGQLDHDEIDAGTDPADPESVGSSPEDLLDAYLLYSVRIPRGTPKLPVFGPVGLGPPDAPEQFRVTRAGWLGVPSALNDGVALDPETHLREYRLRRRSENAPFEKTADVVVTNSCGSLRVVVKKPNAMLVPAHADPTDTPSVPSPDEHDVDSFLCQPASAQKALADGTKLPGIAKRTQVDIQAGDRTARYELVRPTRVCQPVDRTGTPTILKGPNKGQAFPWAESTARHPDVSLACYRAKLARHQVPQAGCGPIDPDVGERIDPPQKRAPRALWNVADDIGTASLEAVRDVEVCLPSRLSYESDM